MKKKAFTLLELLIVVVLMGAVYGLVIYTFSSTKSAPKHSDDFRSYLKPYVSKSSAELVCYNDCRRCAIFSNGLKVAEIANDHFSPELKTYRFNVTGDFNLIRYPDRLIDEKFQNVCLNFTLYPNDSSTPMFIEDRGKVTYFPTYLGSKQEFSSIDEAKDTIYSFSEYPTSTDSYYYYQEGSLAQFY